MRKYLKLAVLFLVLLPWLIPPAYGQPVCKDGRCKDGRCEVPQTFDYGGWRAANKKPQSISPLKTWRHERRERHYKAVVRVMGEKDNGHRSIGSGCVIRWGKRVVVITARHVIKGVKRVFIRHRLRWKRCKILGFDSKWDVAVLEPENPSELDIALLAYAEDGQLQVGDRLESCGYGGKENKLAINPGTLQRFNMPRGESAAADWFAMSGYARQGDSGGPVFRNGKVVGVLWGTNGKIVQATQLGRLHLILKTMLGPGEKVAVVQERPVVAIDRSGLFDCHPFRSPKPPAPLPLAPPPMVNVQTDPRVGNSLASIDRKLDQVIINTTPSMGIEEEKGDKANPALLALVIIGGAVLAFVLYFKNEKGV